jgi:hypothetical protein
MITLEKLGEQEMISSLFNESEDPSSNNEIIEISIPSINFNRDEYKSLSIFIHQYPNLLALLKIVRNGPSVTVYWLGGPSVSDVLQWDWIFVEARLK